METLSSSDDGVRNREKNDLDEFDADNLGLLVGTKGEYMGLLRRSRWHSEGQPLCRRVVRER